MLCMTLANASSTKGSVTLLLLPRPCWRGFVVGNTRSSPAIECNAKPNRGSDTSSGANTAAHSKNESSQQSSSDIDLQSTAAVALDVDLKHQPHLTHAAAAANDNKAPQTGLVVDGIARVKLRNMARALASVLSSSSSYDAPSPTTTARVMDILQPNTNAEGNTSSSSSPGDSEDTSSSAGAGDDHIYASELAAILGHHSQQLGSDDQGRPTPEASMYQNWDLEWFKDDRIQALLFGAVSRLAGPHGALALYHIFFLSSSDGIQAAASLGSPSTFLLSRLVTIMACRHKDHIASRRLIQHAQQANVSLTQDSFIAVLETCAQAGRRDLVRDISNSAAVCGVILDPMRLSQITLLAHAKAGDAPAAVEEFQKLQLLGGGDDIEAYTWVAQALIAGRKVDETLQLVRSAHEKGTRAGSLACAVAGLLIKAELNKVCCYIFLLYTNLLAVKPPPEININIHCWLQLNEFLDLMVERNIRLSLPAVAALVSDAKTRDQAQSGFSFFNSCRSLELFRERKGPKEGPEGRKGPSKAHVNAYHNMFLALQTHGSLDDNLIVYQWMRQDGVKPEK